MIRTCMKGLAGLGALLLVSACATTIEPDGRLDSARALVSQASAYGTSSDAYTSASSYLDQAAAAYEDGDANDYYNSIELTEAYAHLAIAEGEFAEADSALSSLRSEFDSISADAAMCTEELSACQADFSDMSSARLATDLAIISGAMKCERTGGEDGSVKLACQGLNFAFDSASLGVATDARLSAMAAFMEHYPNAAVKVVGHTDTSGPESVNMQLSEARAKAVVDFLTEAGVDASRLSMEGKGESEPIADNNTRAGRMKNRRVDFVISSLE